MTTATACLQCDTAIAPPAAPELGDIVSCPSCGQDHEVLEISPAVQLDLAPDVEEDWGE
jgi:alpha-aminoadipate/glutamate carrier protein LysW